MTASKTIFAYTTVRDETDGVKTVVVIVIGICNLVDNVIRH